MLGGYLDWVGVTILLAMGGFKEQRPSKLQARPCCFVHIQRIVRIEIHDRHEEEFRTRITESPARQFVGVYNPTVGIEPQDFKWGLFHRSLSEMQGLLGALPIGDVLLD